MKRIELDDLGDGDEDEDLMPLSPGLEVVAEVHEEREFCSGCQCEIDPDVCHCGDSFASHGYWSGHSPVPYGCQCHAR